MKTVSTIYGDNIAVIKASVTAVYPRANRFGGRTEDGEYFWANSNNEHVEFDKQPPVWVQLAQQGAAQYTNIHVGDIIEVAMIDPSPLHEWFGYSRAICWRFLWHKMVNLAQKGVCLGVLSATVSDILHLKDDMVLSGLIDVPSLGSVRFETYASAQCQEEFGQNLYTWKPAEAQPNLIVGCKIQVTDFSIKDMLAKPHIYTAGAWIPV